MAIIMTFAIFIFGNTSREWLHQFADHHDTVHHQDTSHKGLFIEEEHHHCQFLEIPLPVFLEPIQWTLQSFSLPDFERFVSTIRLYLFTNCQILVALRGPPFVSSFIS